MKTVEISIIALSLLLANVRIFIFSNLRAYDCFFSGLTAPARCNAGGAWGDVTVWLFVALLMFWVLRRDALWTSYLDAWKSNWPLLIFVTFSSLSLAWTVFFAGSLHSVAVLFLSSLVAAYMGVRYDSSEMLSMLAWFTAVMIAMAFVFVVAAPEVGRAFFYPYNGAWRGMFRNRNYLGSFMAFGSLVFLFRLATASQLRSWKTILNGLFYLLALLLVVFSRSATGGILVVLLHLSFFVAFAWAKWGHHLRRTHYYLFGGFALMGIIFVLLKLDLFLGIFNRDVTLTGRVGLWQYLVENVVRQKPLLGYGFGAVWYGSLRTQVQAALGWPYLIQISDNGFVDILLNLGILGLVLLLVVVALACVRVLKFAYHQRPMASFFPLLAVVYVTLTNISLSYFLEMESYVWLIFVAILFLATPKD